jgi:hypothetical protein
MAKKTATKSPFIFTKDERNTYGEIFKVECYFEDEPNEEAKEIGQISSYPSSADKFCISRVGPDRWNERWNSPRYSSKFADKETAAWALMIIYESIQANSLPSEVRSFLDRRGEHLRKEKENAIAQIYAIQREQAQLQHMANKHGLEFDFGVDIKKEVSDLKEFMERNNDTFYEIGKDFARSLRAYVKSVVKLVDAEAAEDL